MHLKSIVSVLSEDHPVEFYGMSLLFAALPLLANQWISAALLLPCLIALWGLLLFVWFNFFAANKQKLKVHRQSIRQVDEELLRYLSKRRSFVDQVSWIKEEEDLPVVVPKRRRKHVSNLKETSYLEGYRIRNLDELFGVVIKQSERYQHEKRKDEGI